MIQWTVNTPTSTLTLTLAYITIHSTKQAVPSFDSEGLQWLERLHDQLESHKSTKLLINVALLHLQFGLQSDFFMNFKETTNLQTNFITLIKAFENKIWLWEFPIMFE
jgi:hypothetical protein